MASNYAKIATIHNIVSEEKQKKKYSLIIFFFFKIQFTIEMA